MNREKYDEHLSGINIFGIINNIFGDVVCRDYGVAFV